MPKMSSAEYYAHQAKFAPKVEVLKPYDGPEADIHQKILDYCKAKTWYVVHSRMDQKATTAEGVPDFIIATRSGITLWVEAKRKGSKPTEKQRDANYWLRMLGHKAHIIWSIEEFLDVVKGME